MDIVILFIGILTLSSLGYVIYKFNDKGDNTDNTQQRLAYIDSVVTDSAQGSEATSLRFYVSENDATSVTLQI